ncbi:MAG: SIR2 family protein [Haliscomenobacter sp.]|uniref:SIR2 family protein n=1 Tax=Haliscomenobacter sp. TaxID=2717303 RepID=UPI0029AC5037|nr:SIR2 family protein [Haliscomenobacter sp.]MDX2066944.1 SIR2 family protein [Haliscomenobacter sp.]
MTETLNPVSKELDWANIIDSIEAEKCVLFLGSGFYQIAPEQSFENALAEWLGVEQKDHPSIQVYNDDDGFFLFREERSHKRNVTRQIKSFYNQAFPAMDARLAQLAKIPFHLIVSLVPDNILARKFDELGLPYQPDFYFRKRPHSKVFEKPSHHKPMIYNLMGNIEAPDSIVLTHSDFFDYLESVFNGNSMHPELREELESAERYIFLGLPYEKWYFQLLLRVLSVHSEKLRGVVRTALEKLSNNKLETLYKEEFKINFHPNQPEVFVQNLYGACGEAGLLKTLPPPDPALAKLEERSPEEIKELIALAQLEQAFLYLQVYLDRRKPQSHALINELLVLRNRYHLLRQRENRGTIDEKDLRIEYNQISELSLALVDKAAGLGK